MTTITVENTIESALCALSERCDGAATDDGQGFNGRDTQFGKSLANQIRTGRTLSLKQLQAAHKMLKTYTKQLAKLGIDYSALIVAPAPAAISVTLAPMASTVTLQDDKFVLRFEYDRDLVARVKYLRNGRYEPSDKSWRFPLDSADVLQQLTGFDWSAEASEAAYMEVSLAEDNKALSTASTGDIVVDGFGMDLLPFQKAGLEYMIKNDSCILADDMGLGKTMQGLAMIQATQSYPALIICPGGLAPVWVAEIMRALPVSPDQVVIARSDSTREELANALIVIVSYSILGAGWTKPANKREKKKIILSEIANILASISFKIVELDEAHAIKSFDSQQASAAKALISAIEPNHVIPITGTPVLNAPKDYINMLEITGKLEKLGGFWGFVKRYCDAHRGSFGWNFDGSSNLDELNERLRTVGAMVRRMKDDVLTELPPKFRSVVPLSISNRSEYETCRDGVVSYVRATITEIMNKDKKFQKSLKVAEIAGENTAEIKREYMLKKLDSTCKAQVLVELQKLEAIAAKGKMTAAKEWIDNFLESGQKLIIMASSDDLIKALLKAYPHAARITAEQTPEERKANEVRFQTESTCKLIIGAMGKHAGASPAGVGWTLTAASCVAFLSIGWTSAHHDQCEDRARRIGQLSNVTCYYLPAANTVETHKLNIVDKKRKIVDASTGSNTQTEDIANELIADVFGDI